MLCVGDFFGPLKEDDSVDDEVLQLLEGRIEGAAPHVNRGIYRVQPTFYSAPIECYIMQGDQPLPGKVVEKFAKTGGELCKNVFLISAYTNYQEGRD